MASHRRYSVVTEELFTPDGAGFPSYVAHPARHAPARTVVYLHGGGFVAGIDAFHVRYAARLASALDARVVMPDYPLAPEHTWRDSHEALVDLAARYCAESAGDVVLGGDSAGGGLALAVAVALRDRGGPQPSQLLLHSPWVDLTTSTPDTDVVTLTDPWLFIGKVRAYASWWAGSEADLGSARGVAGARRPDRAAAGADVLRLARHAGAGLPAARQAGRRRGLGPHLRRGARPDPRLPDPPLHPRGPPGLAADPGLPAVKAYAVPFDLLDPRTAYDVWRLRQQVFVLEQECLYGDLDGRDPEPETRHVVLEDDGVVLGYARVLDNDDVWRIGRVVLAPPLVAAAWAMC